MRDALLIALAGACACLGGALDARAEPACPSRDFLAAFADDAALQKAFVAVPLRSDSLDVDALPEPKPVSRMLTVDQMRFPLMPGTRDQVQYRLKQVVIAVTQHEMSVRRYTLDTRNQATYAFRREACRMLHHI